MFINNKKIVIVHYFGKVVLQSKIYKLAKKITLILLQFVFISYNKIFIMNAFIIVV